MELVKKVTPIGIITKLIKLKKIIVNRKCTSKGGMDVSDLTIIQTPRRIPLCYDQLSLNNLDSRPYMFSE